MNKSTLLASLFGCILIAASIQSVNAYDYGSKKKETTSNSLRTSAPEGAAVYFIGLKDGDTVTSPIKVRFGLNGMGVAPAGIAKDNTGHHHLLVNLDQAPNMEMPLPANDNVRHFGKGQTETSIELPAGTHTLQLLLGNHYHVPHNPPVMSDKISITVQ